MPDHILICGAGITGASLAYHLAGRGPRVTVMEAGLPANAASGRSFGWINASFYLDDTHHALRVEGIAAHHRLARDLDVPTRWPGCLWFEETGPAADRMEEALTRLGYPCQRLTRSAIAALEPALAAPPDSALLFPAEGATDLAALTETLLAAAVAKGAALILGTPATALRHGTRIEGVATAQGHIAADCVVLACGTGTPALLNTIDLDLPLVPRPGAMIRTRPVPARLSHILAAPGQELRQDAQGRLLAPASANHQSDGADRIADSAAALAEATLDRITALLGGRPALDRVTLADRPVPADGLPVIGTLGPEGLFVAVMHSGATLAPLVGERLAAEVMGQGDDPLFRPYRPARLI